jgi:ribosome-binding factor A
LRVAQDIRDALGSALAQQLSDPRLASAVITRVELSADLQMADVRVRVLAEPTARTIREVLEALQRASGLLRKVIAARLRTKRVPQLRFSYDQALDARARVEELLAEIEQERPRSDPNPDSGSKD